MLNIKKRVTFNQINNSLLRSGTYIVCFGVFTLKNMWTFQERCVQIRTRTSYKISHNTKQVRRDLCLMLLWWFYAFPFYYSIHAHIFLWNLRYGTYACYFVSVYGCYTILFNCVDKERCSVISGKLILWTSKKKCRLIQHVHKYTRHVITNTTRPVIFLCNRYHCAPKTLV